MKKMIRVVIILGALFLIYQIFIIFFINEHESTYSIKTSDNSFMIKEKYKKHGKFNMYYLRFEDKDKNSFVASYDLSKNRQSQVIKDIKTYKDGNLYCIAPILNDKEINNISCRQGNTQVSVSYLHQIKNNSINDFIDILKLQGYNLYDELDIDNKPIKKENNIAVYDNLDDNLYMTMWGYKGVYILKNDSINYKDFLDSDMYFNNYSILSGKYYVTLSVSGSQVISFFVVNIKEGGKMEKIIEKSISKNSYINGVYKNKVYFTDIENGIQYFINPELEKIEEVGSGDNCVYYNGKELQNINSKSLVDEKKLFIEKAISQKLIDVNGNYNYLESNGNYYYNDKNNIYEVVGDFYENKILLFSYDDFKEMKVKNNNVFGINGDTIYMYNNETGIRKVASNRELLYNYANIYDIYFD